ncbi:MAG: copper resistance protein B [Thermomonas sp.]
MSMVSVSLLNRTALAIAVAMGLVAGPVSAQVMDHSKMKMSMPMPKPAPKAAAPAKKVAVKAPAKKAAAKKVQPKKKPTAATKPVMDHSMMQGMDHSKMPMPADDTSMEGMDHSTMPMPADGSMPGMDHAGMAMAPTEPREPIPVLTAADRAAAVPPAHGHSVHDNSIQNFVMLDRLEAWNANPGTGFQWDGSAWIGTDLNRLWLRSEGERIGGKLESADLQVLYGRSVATWWDLVTGIRHDFKPGASQDFVAFGVVGLAPYKFEVEATGYIGQGGQTAARFEAEYETLLTNRLILQPRVEVNLYGKNDERRGIGAGLSTVEAGLRLRYEFTRKFAPYIGVVRERAFGHTANFRRVDGEATNDTRIVAGLRLWF